MILALHPHQPAFSFNTNTNAAKSSTKSQNNNSKNEVLVSNSSNVSLSSSFKQEIAHLSLVELQTQKQELKQELMKNDVSFFNLHGRMPLMII